MDITTECVSLGLRLAQVRADVASQNIAGMNVPGARARQADFSTAIDALRMAAAGSSDTSSLENLDRPTLERMVTERGGADVDRTSLDAEVADITTAGANYQALTEALSRRYGLMELAATGKNG
jgi:flagellar basal body rod protein FlgB